MSPHLLLRSGLSDLFSEERSVSHFHYPIVDGLGAERDANGLQDPYINYKVNRPYLVGNGRQVGTFSNGEMDPKGHVPDFYASRKRKQQPQEA